MCTRRDLRAECLMVSIYLLYVPIILGHTNSDCAMYLHMATSIFKTATLHVCS